MSASAEMQKVLFDALVADAGVGALVGDRIYDGVPPGATFPYVSMGEAQEVTMDEECIDGEEHIFTLHVFDRSHGRLSGAKRINDAIKSALHDAELSMSDPYALAFIRVNSKRAFLDQDGITAHGVIDVRAMVELP